MKRKKLLGSLFLGITLAFTAVGCGSDNDSAAPKERSEGPVLTQEQQKQQLDATARKFMGSIHPDDFKVLDNLAYYVEKHYLDDQSVEPVNNWAKGILQSMTQTIATGQPGYTEYARIIDATKYRGASSIRVTSGCARRTRRTLSSCSATRTATTACSPSRSATRRRL